MLKRFKIWLALASLMGLMAFAGCVAETGDIEGSARGGDRTEVNAASLTVGLSVAGDVALPDDIDASDFEIELIPAEGDVITATFEEDSEGHFVLVVEDLDPEQTYTLNVIAPADVEIDQPSQEVTLVAGEMKNVDINITNVMVEE